MAEIEPRSVDNKDRIFNHIFAQPLINWCLPGSPAFCLTSLHSAVYFTRCSVLYTLQCCHTKVFIVLKETVVCYAIDKLVCAGYQHRNMNILIYFREFKISFKVLNYTR